MQASNRDVDRMTTIASLLYFLILLTDPCLGVAFREETFVHRRNITVAERNSSINDVEHFSFAVDTYSYYGSYEPSILFGESPYMATFIRDAIVESLTWFPDHKQDRVAPHSDQTIYFSEYKATLTFPHSDLPIWTYVEVISILNVIARYAEAVSYSRHPWQIRVEDKALNLRSLVLNVDRVHADVLEIATYPGTQRVMGWRYPDEPGATENIGQTIGLMLTNFRSGGVDPGEVVRDIDRHQILGNGRDRFEVDLNVRGGFKDTTYGDVWTALWEIKSYFQRPKRPYRFEAHVYRPRDRLRWGVFLLSSQTNAIHQADAKTGTLVDSTQALPISSTMSSSF